MELIKERKLAAFKLSRMPTLAKPPCGFAWSSRRGGWVRGTCPYVERKEGRTPLSRRYINRAKYVLDAHLLPMFGSTRIDKITDFAATRLASVTGMRVGEVPGVKARYLRGNALNVCGQRDTGGEYLDHTKTRANRVIPVAPGMVPALSGLMEKNKAGFLFSRDEDKSAVSYDGITSAYKTALNTIGISPEEYTERGLSFHSWRHFLNTRLLAKNISGSKVRAVTGHLSEEITGWYTHFKPDEFTEVMEVQESLMRSGRSQRIIWRGKKRGVTRFRKESAGLRVNRKR
jgi:integrase